MEGAAAISIVSALTAVGAVLVALFKGRGENKNKATENRTSIDALIDARVSSELTRVYERLDEQDKEIRMLKTSDRNTKDIVRRWFHDLISWDRMGHHGRMPLPARADMALLDLDPNESTLTAEELAAMRAATFAPNPKETP